MKRTMWWMPLGAICLAITMAAIAEDPTPPPDDVLKWARAETGWQDLFTPDLSNAMMRKDGWAWENGVLVSKGRGDIWTRNVMGISPFPWNSRPSPSATVGCSSGATRSATG